ncbi:MULTISPECIES: MFS transporter [Pseudomonas syringae group]|uniref:MFS transporter n=2 Tax=Pseudomonas syringae group TaxID=136849 RepID=UPI0006E6F2FF|nr:MFS transporter [Pseudomonas coronafaciens]KPX35369.1 Major facilitator family transporter [Pseudomonas coronafaciens pv. garcae]RMN93095.1 Major facilitator family transporter [Pseudomonas coronafaciens pv. coronafaciens]RMS96816.1 Major facilitator family transporter [Pseudomonas coronafaciens pv. oryzae]RMS99994.1 Major facilitator family transporter [Pseudomonas coronafaciens pv. oryzae]RMV88237.1 Major facilitator family transporter [Pseudomonas coronafaciens pv. garcae]
MDYSGVRVWLPNIATFLLLGSIGCTIPLLSRSLEDSGLTQARIGIVSGAFWLAPIFFRVYISRLLEYKKKKILIVFGLVTTAFAYLITNEVEGIFQLVSVRFAQGIGYTISIIGILAFAVNSAQARERASQFSINSIFSFLGYALGPALGEFVIQCLGYARTFEMASVMCFLAAAFICAGREPLLNSPSGPTISTKSKKPPPLRSTCIQLMLVAAPLGMAEAFVPIFSRQEGYGSVSAFFLIFACATLAIRVNMSKLSCWRSFTWLAQAGALLCTLALTVLAASNSKSMMLAASSFMGLGWGLVFPSLIGLNAEQNPNASSTQLSIFSSVYDFSFFFGQVLFGLIISSFGYRLSFVLAGIACLVSFASIKFRLFEGG